MTRCVLGKRCAEQNFNGRIWNCPKETPKKVQKKEEPATAHHHPFSNSPTPSPPLPTSHHHNTTRHLTSPNIDKVSTSPAYKTKWPESPPRNPKPPRSHFFRLESTRLVPLLHNPINIITFYILWNGRGGRSYLTSPPINANHLPKCGDYSIPTHKLAKMVHFQPIPDICTWSMLFTPLETNVMLFGLSMESIINIFSSRRQNLGQFVCLNFPYLVPLPPPSTPIHISDL